MAMFEVINNNVKCLPCSEYKKRNNPKEFLIKDLGKEKLGYGVPYCINLIFI